MVDRRSQLAATSNVTANCYSSLLLTANCYSSLRVTANVAHIPLSTQLVFHKYSIFHGTRSILFLAAVSSSTLELTRHSSRTIIIISYLSHLLVAVSSLCYSTNFYIQAHIDLVFTVIRTCKTAIDAKIPHDISNYALLIGNCDRCCSSAQLL
jgi:hypothetical protein